MYIDGICVSFLIIIPFEMKEAEGTETSRFHDFRDVLPSHPLHPYITYIRRYFYGHIIDQCRHKAGIKIQVAANIS